MIIGTALRRGWRPRAFPYASELCHPIVHKKSPLHCPLQAFMAVKDVATPCL